MRYVILVVPLLAILAPACGGGGAPTTLTATPAPTVTAIPESAVESPEADSLLLPGYVLDQSLEVSLDGADPGQLVVISHTTRQVFSAATKRPQLS